jgi:hypothetical protein
LARAEQPRGRIGGCECELTWRDGSLAGDDLVKLRVQILLEDRRRLLLTATGPELEAGLEPDWLAARTIVEAFDKVLELEGHVSDCPLTKIPPGAVA